MPSKIRKRGANSYELTVSGGLEDGKQRLYRKTVKAENMDEAEKLHTLFAADCLKGKVIQSGKEKMTLQEFYDYWKHHYAEKNQEMTTLAYNDDLSERILKALGHLKIDKIRTKQILEFIDQLYAPDAGHGDKPLSPNTIRKHYSLMKTLFNYAVKWEFIISNPMDKVDPPKKLKTHKEILSEEEMSRFIMALMQHKHLKHRLWVFLAFSLGLRREEIFGLQWQDIDFNKKTVTIARAAVYVSGKGIIVKDTKSDNSYRVISTPQDIIHMLQEWREEVVGAYKRRARRNKIVTLEDPVSPDKWLFPQPNGSVGHPHAFNNFTKTFYKENNLKPVTPHLLRHMMGSYLLKAGIDLAAVSKKLGHANKSFTANTYIHALESTEKQSADVMQNILNDLKTKKGQA